MLAFPMDFSQVLRLRGAFLGEGFVPTCIRSMMALYCVTTLTHRKPGIPSGFLPLFPKSDSPLAWVFKPHLLNRLSCFHHPFLSAGFIISLHDPSSHFSVSRLKCLQCPLVITSWGNCKHTLPWILVPAGWSSGFSVWSLPAWPQLT